MQSADAVDKPESESSSRVRHAFRALLWEALVATAAVSCTRAPPVDRAVARAQQPQGGQDVSWSTLSQALLADFSSWDAASDVDRASVAHEVARRLDGYEFSKLEHCRRGAQARQVAFYRHTQTGDEFALVPAGSFEKGSPLDEPERNPDETLHTVTLSKPFLMSVTECSQRSFERATGRNPSTTRDPDLPVDSVTWDAAREFCESTGCQLPTEAQWEFACRAGARTAYTTGSGPEQLLAYEWIESNSGGRTHRVGEKSPNAYGLRDMLGNVHEWCSDGYGPYGTAPVVDPQGTASSMTRVVRGGNSSAPLRFDRCASRLMNEPAGVHPAKGFRIVKNIEFP